MLRTMSLAAQGLLDTFIHLSLSQMLALPPHIYGGRLIYAAIILMKLDRAAMGSGSRWNGSIKVDHPRVEVYIEQLLHISKQLIMADERSSLSRALLIVPQLKEWLHAQGLGTASLSEGVSPRGDIRTKHDHEPVVSTVHTRTGSLNSPSADMKIPFDISTNCSEPLGGIEFQSENLLAQAGSSDSENDPSKSQMASDSWFWEFLNTDMTH